MTKINRAITDKEYYSYENKRNWNKPKIIVDNAKGVVITVEMTRMVENQSKAKWFCSPAQYWVEEKILVTAVRPRPYLCKEFVDVETGYIVPRISEWYKTFKSYKEIMSENN